MMSVSPAHDIKSKNPMDVLDRLDLSTLSYREISECIAKVKSEFEKLNAHKKPSIEQMDHKLKALKLWRRLIEHFISLEEQQEQTLANISVDKETHVDIQPVSEPTIVKEKPENSQAEPQTEAKVTTQTNIAKEDTSAVNNNISTRMLSAREMAEKIDKASKYVPIQLLTASFVRGVQMPEGLFIVVDAQEAYDLIRGGRATLLNQS
jgi:uncharacterized small protein (DUF1192 family)